jgi:ESS family glutamate:Na+ symporter
VFLLKFIPQFDALVNEEFMENVTYHCLAIGFIALAFKKNENKKEKGGGLLVVKTGAAVVATYLIQGVIGLIITILLSFFMLNLLPASGLLMMLGFGQGPTQALNFGTIFENQGGFVGGKSFGLTLASVGFLVACICGVVWMNILKKKVKIVIKGADDSVDYQTTQEISNPRDIPLSESMDRFTMNIAIISLTYFLAWLFMYGVTAIIDAGYLGNFGVNTVKPLIWGFNFLFGTIFAILVKSVMKLFQKKNLMKRDYTNNFMLNRISGFVFDLMILACVAAIKFEAIEGLWLPILLLTVGGTTVTFIFLNFICKKLYPTYRYEAMASLFGMLTGTASTGTILLRELDPDFETPAANNMVLQTVPAMLFGFPLILLVGWAYQSLTAAIVTLIIAAAMFVAFTIFICSNKKKKADGFVEKGEKND